MDTSKEEQYADNIRPITSAPSAAEDDTKPELSHEVIATYIADAVRSVVGIASLRTSAWKSISSRIRETHSQGIVIRDSPPNSLDVDIHVCVAWGVNIPSLAQEVEDIVRSRVTAYLSLDLNSVTLFIDEIANPSEDNKTVV